MAREIEFHLKDTDQQIARKIMKKLAYQGDRAMKSLARTGRSALKPTITSAIMGSPELRSLQGGALQGALGLYGSQAAKVPMEIATAVSDSIELIARPTRFKAGALEGGLSLSIQPTDFANLKALAGITTTYYSTRYKKNVTLEWLDWLLNRGDEIIVGGYVVKFGSHGRSGKGKMKKSTGAAFKISPAYSGTPDDNFLTRSLNDPSVRNSLLKVLNRLMNQYFSG